MICRNILFFSRGGLKGNPLLQMEHGYCSIRPTPRKVFLEADGAIARPYKWASFSGAGDGITCT
jgi:hypothetical protein